MNDMSVPEATLRIMSSMNEDLCAVLNGSIVVVIVDRESTDNEDLCGRVVDRLNAITKEVACYEAAAFPVPGFREALELGAEASSPFVFINGSYLVADGEDFFGVDLGPLIHPVITFI